MPLDMMVAPAVGGTGGCKPGTERVGSAPLLRQRTLQISKLYLVTVAVTIGGKVDTAETVMVVILNSLQ